ncbi:hypothetical protein JCM5353_001876 [Sporobolomyces roseus]
MDEPAKRYATFVNNINTIADAWGRDTKHNEDLWSTQEWVTEWHTRISEDFYKSCKLEKWKLAEEVLNPNKNPLPDIYDPLFPSVERLASVTFSARLQLPTLKWMSQLVEKDIIRTAARNLDDLKQRSSTPEETLNLQLVVLSALEVARDSLDQHSASYGIHRPGEYNGWVNTISGCVRTISRNPEFDPLQVLACLESCQLIAERTFDRTRGAGLSDYFLLRAYLPSSITFQKLCRLDLPGIASGRVTMEAPKRKRKTRGGLPPTQRPIQASSAHGNRHLPYVPIGDESNARKRHSSFSRQQLPLTPLMIPPSSAFYNLPLSATSPNFYASPEPSPALSYHSYHSSPHSNLASSFHSESDLGYPPHFNLDSAIQSMPPPPRRRRTSSIPFVAQNRSDFAPTHASVIDHDPPFSNALQRYDTAPQLNAPSFDYRHPQPPSFSASAHSSSSSSPEINRHQQGPFNNGRRRRSSDLRRESMTNAVRPLLLALPKASSTQVASVENSGATLDSLEEMLKEIIEKYMKMDEEWGGDVRRDLTKLLRGLEKGDHTVSGGTDVGHYFDRLKRETEVRKLPTPLEMSARETTNPKYQERNKVAQADYVLWVEAIKGSSTVVSLRIIAILWALEKVVSWTFDKAEALGVVTRLLLYSYLPDTATFLKWCQNDLEASIEEWEEEEEEKAEQKEVQKRKRENKTLESIHGHPSTTTVAAAHPLDIHYHNRYDDEGGHSGNAPKRHSSSSQSTSFRPFTTHSTALSSNIFAETPASPTYPPVFGSPESTAVSDHLLASSTQSLPADLRQPWRRTSSSHSLIGHSQHHDSGSSTDALETSFTSDQFLHSPEFVPEKRNHSFSSSNSSNPFVFYPPASSLRRISTAPQFSAHDDAHESAIHWSPSFSPLPASFNQQMPPPSSFTLPSSAYPSSIYAVSSRYPPARRPSNTVPRHNLRRPSAANAARPHNLSQPSVEQNMDEVVQKYADLEQNWGTVVREKLNLLLADLRGHEAADAGARVEVAKYLSWLRRIDTRHIPLPHELI